MENWPYLIERQAKFGTMFSQLLAFFENHTHLDVHIVHSTLNNIDIETHIKYGVLLPLKFCNILQHLDIFDNLFSI